MFSFSLDLNVNKPSGQAGTYQVQTIATGLSKNFVLFLFIMFSFSLDVNANVSVDHVGTYPVNRTGSGKRKNVFSCCSSSFLFL
jgi:hypothetical protein